MSRTKLTVMQATFLEERLKTPDDQSGAYERACKALSRIVPKALRQNASEMAKLPQVEDAWEEMRRTRAVRVQLSTDDVLQELKDVIAVDVVEVMLALTAEGMAALTKAQRKAIASLKVSYDEKGRPVFEVKMWSRPEMLKMAGAHTGAWQRGEGPIIQGDMVQNNIQYVFALPQKAKDHETWAKKHNPGR